jgi:hypothetical protein
MATIDLVEELKRWLDEYGESAPRKSGGTYQKITVSSRQSKLTILMERLKELGAVRDFFRGNNKDLIIKSCIPRKETAGLTNRVYRKYYFAATEDFDFVKVRIFGTASDEAASGKEGVVVDSRGEEEVELTVLHLKDEQKQQNKEEKDYKDHHTTEKPVAEIKEIDTSKIKDDSVYDIVDPNLEDWLKFE